MAVTQYIGSRYVPLFADPVEWSSENTYEPLTIVLHEGNSYTSKQAVPKGIAITNEEFWALTGNYNAQIELYRRETAAAQEDAAEAQEAATAAQEAANTAQNDIETLLPKAEFSAENTVKKYVDDSIEQTKAYVDDSIEEAKSTFTIGTNGLFGISIDQDTHKNKLFYYENETMRYVKEYPWVDDSSAVFYINDTFYFVGNNHYRFTKDLNVWSAEYNITTNPFNLGIDSPKMWGFSLCEGVNGQVYCFGSMQYRAEQTEKNAAGFNTYYMRVMYTRVTVNDDGTLTFGEFEPLAFAGNQTNGNSYIDPYMIYSPSFGGYVFAVKNEMTCKIEVYSGTLGDLRITSLTNPVVGIEAPQLVATDNAIFMFAHAYAPGGTAEVLHTNSRYPEFIVGSIIGQYGVFFSTYQWRVIKTNFHARHIGITKVVGNALQQIYDIGISTDMAYKYFQWHSDMPRRITLNATGSADYQNPIHVPLLNLSGFELRYANSLASRYALDWVYGFEETGCVSLICTNNVYIHGVSCGTDWYGSLSNNIERVIGDPTKTQPVYQQFINCASNTAVVATNARVD